MDHEEAPSRDQRTRGDSDNTFSAIQPTSDNQQVRLNLDEVLDILGRADGEFTAVCYKPVAGIFRSSVVKSTVAGARVESLPENSNVWFSVNPPAGPEPHKKGRGTVRQARSATQPRTGGDPRRGPAPVDHQHAAAPAGFT